MVQGRALPKSERERGNPFAPGLSPVQRAARLEGRKVITSLLFAGISHETMYRVDLFRKFMAEDEDAEGKKGVKRACALVQFYGVRATRSFNTEAKSWSSWDVDDRPKLHTVEVRANTKIKQK